MNGIDYILRLIMFEVLCIHFLTTVFDSKFVLNHKTIKTTEFLKKKNIFLKGIIIVNILIND